MGGNPLRLLNTEIANAIFGTDRDFSVVIADVEGRGSCFYHSVMYAMDIDGYRGMPRSQQRAVGRGWRCALEDKMRIPENQRGFMESQRVRPATLDRINTLIGVQCNPNQWAEEPDIQFAAWLLHLNILFLDLKTGGLFCGVHGAREQPTILIAWKDRQHFEPILMCPGDPNTLPVKGARLEGVFPPKSPIALRINGSYELQCKINQRPRGGGSLAGGKMELHSNRIQMTDRILSGSVRVPVPLPPSISANQYFAGFGTEASMVLGHWPPIPPGTHFPRAPDILRSLWRRPVNIAVWSPRGVELYQSGTILYVHGHPSWVGVQGGYLYRFAPGEEGDTTHKEVDAFLGEVAHRNHLGFVAVESAPRKSELIDAPGIRDALCVWRATRERPYIASKFNERWQEQLMRVTFTAVSKPKR